MSVHFDLKKFFQPLPILRFKAFLDRSQWWSPAQFEAYQFERIQTLLRHAAREVPYYKELFREKKINPEKMTTTSDLRQIPILTKETLSQYLPRFASVRRPSSHCVHTSGTHGKSLELLMDRRADVLEFTYYWRAWGWAGYHLGDCFAELSTSFFLKNRRLEQKGFYFQPYTNRLLLNSLKLSPERVLEAAAAMRRYQPKFLKGSPSALYFFTRFLKEKGGAGFTFKAIFSQGEVLTPQARRLIEDYFQCKVYDGYGQMERVAAISECPFGSMHIHPEYGMVELLPLEDNVIRSAGSDPARLRRLIATGLHNFAMPLIRYDTGDLVELADETGRCDCGRDMPRIKKILGRDVDVIRTEDGSIVTALYTVFNGISGIETAQIEQENLRSLRVKVVKSDNFNEAQKKMLAGRIHQFAGESMKVDIEEVDLQLLQPKCGKFRMVVSHINPSDCADEAPMRNIL